MLADNIKPAAQSFQYQFGTRVTSCTISRHVLQPNIPSTNILFIFRCFNVLDDGWVRFYNQMKRNHIIAFRFDFRRVDFSLTWIKIYWTVIHTSQSNSFVEWILVTTYAHLRQYLSMWYYLCPIFCNFFRYIFYFTQKNELFVIYCNCIS